MSDKIKCLLFIDKLLTNQMSVSIRTKLRISRNKISSDRLLEDVDLLNVCEEAIRQQINDIPNFNSLKGN